MLQDEVDRTVNLGSASAVTYELLNTLQNEGVLRGVLASREVFELRVEFFRNPQIDRHTITVPLGCDLTAHVSRGTAPAAAGS